MVQQAIGHGSSDQSWGGGLVWHCSQDNVQVILEQGKIPRVLIPEMVWQQVKEAGTMDTQRPLAWRTFEGADLGMLVGMANLPLLSCHCQEKE